MYQSQQVMFFHPGRGNNPDTRPPTRLDKETAARRLPTSRTNDILTHTHIYFLRWERNELLKLQPMSIKVGGKRRSTVPLFG